MRTLRQGNTEHSGPVALMVEALTLTRLTAGLRGLVRDGRDYWAVDIGEPEQRIIERLAALRPRGVLMEYREGLTEAVAGMGIPVVVVMADLLIDGVGVVNVDDHAVGRLAAQTLLEMRLAAYGYFGVETVVAPERLGGYRAGLGGVQLRVFEVAERQLDAALRRQLDAWLGGMALPCGIFVAHDPLGREIVGSCNRLGLRIPEDVAVLTASDDAYTCELVWPQLSSVEIPWAKVGQLAGAQLEAQLAGGAAASLLVAPTGVSARGSTDRLGVEEPRVQRLVRQFRADFAAPVGVADCVRRAGLALRSAERLCRQYLGRTPMQVLTQIRVEHARNLLENSNLRVSEVAERSGFGSPERMTVALRAAYGRTAKGLRTGRVGGEWSHPSDSNRGPV